MIATSIATLAGLNIKMPKLVLSSILILLGLYIGNYIDKSLFSQIHQWAWTSCILLVYYFKRIYSIEISSKIFEIRRKNINFSAAPGALGPQYLAEDEKN